MAKRLLIKLSGEVLKGSLQSGIDWKVVDQVCGRIAKVIRETKAQLGFVIGGGNIFRGATPDLPIRNYDRLLGDSMGMMATVINGLALVERFAAHGIHAMMQSGVKIDGVAELFHQDTVERQFQSGGVVVFVGGIGNPYFSTDMTAALRSLQIKADYLAKATKVDGIYNKDPVKFSDAQRYEAVTYEEILKQKLEIMDLTAMQLLSKNKMKLLVFDMMEEGALERICNGESVGTLVEE